MCKRETGEEGLICGCVYNLLGGPLAACDGGHIDAGWGQVLREGGKTHIDRVQNWCGRGDEIHSALCGMGKESRGRAKRADRDRDRVVCVCDVRVQV